MKKICIAVFTILVCIGLLSMSGAAALAFYDGPPGPMMGPPPPPEYEPVILEADLEVVPHTINLKSKGKFIKAFIELPEDFAVEDIDVSTILLNESIGTVGKAKIGDHDDDGINDLKVKFNRSSVKEVLDEGGEVRIDGSLFDGTVFEALDEVKVK